MNLYVHWIKKHWLPLALGVLVIVLVSMDSCDDARYKRKITGLDDEITVLKDDNLVLEGKVIKGVDRAIKAEGVVAKKEARIEASRLRILELEEKEAVIVEVIAMLPPTEMVSQLRGVLECVEIELTDDGVLFSVECARAALVGIERFSLAKKLLDETRFSLSESQSALLFQKKATWEMYGVAANLGSQVLNYKTMVKKLNLKFDLCEKQRKKGFWSGLKIGLALGAGVTVTLVIVIPIIKAIF